MVMSTRRSETLGTTLTIWAGAARIGPVLQKAIAIISTSPSTSPAPLRIHLASRHHLLRFVVEGNFLARFDGGDIHAQRNRMRVPGLNRRVRRLARPDALHPVAHVG